MTRHIGIMNACDADDVERAVRTTLVPPRVVALGANASEALHKLGIAHGAVPHPQYVRRFHYWAGDLYARAIAQATIGGDLLKWRP
jgi:hypothetical protein